MRQSRLSLIRFIEKRSKGNSYSLYKCACGNEKIIRNARVKDGTTKSCGCLINEYQNTRVIKEKSKSLYKSGYSLGSIATRFKPRHGMDGTPEYKACMNAKRRCNNPKVNNWEHYGGRGIQFRFKNFEEFYAEIGPRPAGHSLDRIDNDGHYEVGNIQWATRSQQNKNQRRYQK